jgi:deoxyribodipyrimidine photolyase-related protein
MVLGNFMFLAEIHPQEILRWFMEMFIDAYEWVMIPNIFGMSQFSDGGLMSTKPYFSSSNYLKKMTNFNPGKWCDIWDGMYWRFIGKHLAFFQSNPRTRFTFNLYKRMKQEKLNYLILKANIFLQELIEGKDPNY